MKLKTWLFAESYRRKGMLAGLWYSLISILYAALFWICRNDAAILRVIPLISSIVGAGILLGRDGQISRSSLLAAAGCPLAPLLLYPVADMLVVSSGSTHVFILLLLLYYLRETALPAAACLGASLILLLLIKTLHRLPGLRRLPAPCWVRRKKVGSASAPKDCFRKGFLSGLIMAFFLLLAALIYFLLPGDLSLRSSPMLLLQTFGATAAALLLFGQGRRIQTLSLGIFAVSWLGSILFFLLVVYAIAGFDPVSVESAGMLLVLLSAWELPVLAGILLLLRISRIPNIDAELYVRDLHCFPCIRTEGSDPHE